MSNTYRMSTQRIKEEHDLKGYYSGFEFSSYAIEFLPDGTPQEIAPPVSRFKILFSPYRGYVLVWVGDIEYPFNIRVSLKHSAADVRALIIVGKKYGHFRSNAYYFQVMRLIAKLLYSYDAGLDIPF